MDKKIPQVPNAWGIYPQTCSNCRYNTLSSFVEKCVKCMREDKPGDRFPMWESKE